MTQGEGLAMTPKTLIFEANRYFGAPPTRVAPLPVDLPPANGIWLEPCSLPQLKSARYFFKREISAHPEGSAAAARISLIKSPGMKG